MIYQSASAERDKVIAARMAQLAEAATPGRVWLGQQSRLGRTVRAGSWCPLG